MPEIYALFSGRDCVVRYVGQTAGSRKDRFKEHITDRDSRLRKWFIEEWKHGFPIQCELLEWCKYDEREALETRWINRFPNLLNDRKYCRWHEHAAVKVPAIIQHKRRYRYNVGGFRGVHYDTAMDRYFVLLTQAADSSGRAAMRCPASRHLRAATSGFRIGPRRSRLGTSSGGAHCRICLTCSWN